MFYVFLLFSICQTISYGKYATDADTCIRNGVNVTAGSLIDQIRVTNSSCAFLMQANRYIVIQPLLVNINLYTDIKLFLITKNGVSKSKLLIYNYYGRFLYKDLTLIAQGYQQFALVVLSKGDYKDFGQFKFVFRTNCYMEFAAENYPYFNSPNYYPQHPKLSNLIKRNDLPDQNCVYKIYSTNKIPFTLKFQGIRNFGEYGVYINNSMVTQDNLYSFSGEFNVTISLKSVNFTLKFNASVDVGFLPQFISINQSQTEGIPQLQIFGKGYNFQYGSLSHLDSQILCRSLGYGGVNSISKTNSSLPLLSHYFRCRGPEKNIFQCVPISNKNLYFNHYYSNALSATVLDCSEKFPIRLKGGNETSGYVQVKLGIRWGYICADNMDLNAGDVLCQELGFRGIYEMTKSSRYEWMSDMNMRSLRCGQHSKLTDCYFETPKSLNEHWNRYNDHFDYFYGDLDYNEYRFDRFNYFDNCIEGAIHLSCRKHFVLNPEYFEGYMIYHESFVCNNSFTTKNAEVYCRHLGYPGVRKTTYNGEHNWKLQSFVDLFCNGSESSPSECQVNPTKYCPDNQLAKVICQTVAMVGGEKLTEGRVEVFYRGERGLLCDDNYDMKDAEVLCRQMGFAFAQNFSFEAGNLYGRGNEVFLLSNLNCNGTEESIEQCIKDPWKKHNCNKNEISGLVCVPKSALNQTCGTSYISEQNDITSHGYNTTFGSNPWQARLIPETATEWCSATIINKNWLITSANCFTLQGHHFFITVGSTKRNWDSSHWSSTNKVKYVFIHPLYSAVTGVNNIALVKVSTPIALESYVSSVCLPSSDFSFNGTQCITTGWNHRLSSKNRPLMGQRVSLYNSQYCISQTRLSSDQMSRYLCSHNNIEPWAVFNGESGGPLVCNKNGRSTLVGIVAQSIDAARATNIRLYTRVDAYINWIYSTLKKNS